MARNWLSMIVRLAALTAVVGNVLAMMVGRFHAPANSPDPLSALAAPTPVAMTGLVVNPSFFRFQGDPSTPLYYDVNTSQFVRIPLASGEALDAISFAPTANADGQRMMIGRWRRWSGQGSEAVLADIGLARVCYPTGKLVDNIATEILPVEPPCWSPPELATNLVMFAAGDGRVYRLQLSNQDPTDDGEQGDSTPIGLGIDKSLTQTHGRLRLQDLHWCPLPGLERIVLASVSVLSTDSDSDSGSSERFSYPRAWWFRLDSALSMLEDGGPLLPGQAAGLTGEPTQRHPKLAASPADEGGIRVVYLEKSPRESSWRLRTAPVTVAIGTDVPRILPQTRNVRTLADGCLSHSLGLSEDGCWVAAARNGPDRQPRIERFQIHAEGAAPGRESRERPARAVAAR